MMEIHSNAWLFQNATAIGDGNIFHTGRNNQITLFLTGDSTSRTVQFEGSDASDNWFEIPATKLPEKTSATFTIGNDEVWVIDITNYVSIRARISEIEGGTCRITGRIVDSSHALATASSVTLIDSKIALPIDIQYNNLQDDNPLPVKLAGSGYHAIAFEQITISSSVEILTALTYDNATQATIIVENAPIRYRVDSGIPTTSVGMPANVADIISLNSIEDIANFKAISTSTDALLSVTYSI